MNIYFAAAVRGGREELPFYEKIVSLLKQYGTVLTEHVADSSLSSHGETEMTSHEILEREMSRLKESDIVIAEVTTSSLGVGAVIANAIELHKKIFCLYRGIHTDKLSALIKGQEEIKVYTYQNETDLHQIFKKIF